jgi:hypothetical protein
MSNIIAGRLSDIGREYLETGTPIFGTRDYNAYVLRPEHRVAADEHDLDMLNFVLVNSKHGTVESLTMAHPTIISLCKKAQEAMDAVCDVATPSVRALSH